MQVLNLKIKAIDDVMEIQFSTSNVSTTYIFCTDKQLKRHYKINKEDLTMGLCRKIIKDNRFKMHTEIKFETIVKSQYNKKRDMWFQIENNLAHITNFKTKQELFVPFEQIKDFTTFSQKDFKTLLTNKKKIVPLNTNIQTSDFSFDMFGDNIQ